MARTASTTRARWREPTRSRSPQPRQRPGSRAGLPRSAAAHLRHEPNADQADAVDLAERGAGSLVRDGGRLVVSARVAGISRRCSDALRAAGPKWSATHPDFGTVDLCGRGEGDLRDVAAVPGVESLERGAGADRQRRWRRARGRPGGGGGRRRVRHRRDLGGRRPDARRRGPRRVRHQRGRDGVGVISGLVRHPRRRGDASRPGRRQRRPAGPRQPVQAPHAGERAVRLPAIASTRAGR